MSRRYRVGDPTPVVTSPFRFADVSVLDPFDVPDTVFSLSPPQHPSPYPVS